MNNEASMNNHIENIWQPHTQQAIFRKLMNAMSRPGSVEEVADLSEASTVYRAVLATLLDAEVSLCDHDLLLEKSDWPLLQAASLEDDAADYILCSGSKPVSISPKLGTLPCPDYSATLVVVVESFLTSDSDNSHRLCLTGAGINGEQQVCITGLDSSYLVSRESWNAAFPLGVDMILTTSTQIMALPRSTNVEVLV